MKTTTPSPHKDSIRNRVWFVFLCLFVLSSFVLAAPANRFVWTQIRWDGAWNPYPTVWPWATEFIARNTRLNPWPDPRWIPFSDDALFESPMVVLAGRGSLSLTVEDENRLRQYLSVGGFVFLDDSEATGTTVFHRSVQDLPNQLFPGGRWIPVPRDHALYRSFFMVQGASGRRRVSTELNGFWLADRLVMVWSSNDLLGALAKTAEGSPLFEVEPGGESQRRESEKLFLNIVMFSVTGTYKTDAVHQPFLEKKGTQP